MTVIDNGVKPTYAAAFSGSLPNELGENAMTANTNPRKAWKAPKLQRLNVAQAENGGQFNSDGRGNARS